MKPTVNRFQEDLIIIDLALIIISRKRKLRPDPCYLTDATHGYSSSNNGSVWKHRNETTNSS